MAETKLQARQRQTVAEYFQDQITRYCKTLPDLTVSNTEAKMLTLNTILAVQKHIDEGKFEWTQENIKYFLPQLQRTISLGLDAGQDEVYAIPYGKMMKLDPSYKGLQKMILMYALGKKITDMLVFVVREGEEFSVTYGRDTDDWKYKSISFNTKPPVGYVTVLIYEDGTDRVMEHTLEDIEARRKKAKTQNVWKEWPIEMAKKTAIRRHAKTVRLRQDIADQLDELIEDDGDENIKDITPQVIDLELPAAHPEPEQKREPEADPTPVEPMPQEEADYMDQLPIDESWMRG